MNKKTLALTTASTTIPIALIIGGMYIAATASAHGNRLYAKVVLTEEQRQALEHIRELREAGDAEGAKAAAEEAGLPQPGMFRHAPMMEGHEEVKQAILDGDYAKFQELMADAPFAKDIIEEDFVKLQAAHQFLQDGDLASARQIMEELGMKPPHRPGRMGAMMRHRTELTDKQEAKLKEAHDLKMNGDQEGAMKLFDELRAELQLN